MLKRLRREWTDVPLTRGTRWCHGDVPGEVAGVGSFPAETRWWLRAILLSSSGCARVMIRGSIHRIAQAKRSIVYIRLLLPRGLEETAFARAALTSICRNPPLPAVTPVMRLRVCAWPREYTRIVKEIRTFLPNYREDAAAGPDLAISRSLSRASANIYCCRACEEYKHSMSNDKAARFYSAEDNEVLSVDRSSLARGRGDITCCDWDRGLTGEQWSRDASW